MGKLDELRQHLPLEMASWMHGQEEITDVWRGCPRADWLVILSLRLGLGRTTVVRATARLVSVAVASRHTSDLRPNRAVVTTLKWLTGRSQAKETWTAGFCAMDAAKELRDPLDIATARAAACLAFACDEQADDVFYAHRAYAASAASEASLALGGESLAADRLREEIPLTVVLEAFDALPEPAPPSLGSDSYEISTNPTRG